MKAVATRISHWTVALDFAQTLWTAAAAGLAFSVFVGAVVALIASAG